MSGPCLVLDFDGTILDTEEPDYRSWSELWEEHGHDLVMTDWQAGIGTRSGFDPLRELERRLGFPLEEAATRSRRARRDELLELHPLKPGIELWLQEARRLGIPVGIASSSTTTWVETHLQRLGLKGEFQSVICFSEDTPSKPDPTVYLLACSELGGDPHLSVAREDSPHGVAAAVAAGLFTVAVPHGLTASLDLSSADVTVDSLHELELADALSRARQRARPGR